MRGMLQVLRKTCLEIAKTHSDYDDKKLSPLHGYCGVVSYLVYKLFGGVIVTGKINDQRHYWNRLENGEEIDLTSCQFGGDGFTPLKKGRKSPKILEGGFTDPLYLSFYFEILKKLNHK